MGRLAAPHQQPPAPARRLGLGQGPPAPIIPARAFGPIAGTEAGPALRGQRRHEGLHLPWPPVQPDISARYRQHVGLWPPFQPHPQLASMAVHTVAGHPLRWHSSREGPVPASAGPAAAWSQSPGRPGSRPGGSAHDRWSTLQADRAPVQQGMAQPTRIGHKHANLAVLNLPRRTLYWRATPAEYWPFFKNPVSSMTITPWGSLRCCRMYTRSSSRTAWPPSPHGPTSTGSHTVWPRRSPRPIASCFCAPPDSAVLADTSSPAGGSRRARNMGPVAARCRSNNVVHPCTTDILLTSSAWSSIQ